MALVFMALCGAAYGQNSQLTGEILDEKAQPLGSATVVLLNPADSTLLYFAITGKSGRFVMNNIKTGNYLLQGSMLGYTTLYRSVSIPLRTGDDIGTLIMTSKVFNIDEVTVSADRIPIRIKKDTIEYDAKAFKVKPDGVAEDLIKKLPGLEVDRAGNIKAMGEDVKNVLVDGKEFFGNDPKVATRNLPADAIDRVQLFDKQTDESQFTGIDDGERNPTLNILLDENKKSGIMGDVSAGAGTGGHGDVNGKIYRFTKKTQLAALGMFNNINRFGFSMGDYINFSGGLQSMSSGGGHVVLGGDNSFPVNFGQPVYGSGSNGAAGLNFSISESKSNRIFASYLGNGSKRTLSESSVSRNFLPDASFRTDETKNQVKRDTAHRLNFGVRRLIGENQNLIINGGISYSSSYNPLNSSSGSFADDVQINTLERRTSELRKGLSGNADASYLLKINEGRTILKVSGRANYSGSNEDSRYYNNTSYFNPLSATVSNQFYDLSSDLGNYSGTISLTQRTTKRSFADISLTGGYSTDDLARRQGDAANGMIPDLSLSPDFSKTEKFIRPGLTWKLSSVKSQLTMAVLASLGNYTTVLDGDAGVSKNYSFLTPRASWEYEYRSGRRLMANYSTSVITPGVSRLLPVVNNMNTLSLFYGNRDLKPSYMHDARIMWWLFDQFSFTTLLAGINMSYTRDKIGNERTVDANLGQTISLINVKDDWTAGGDIDFSTPIKALGIKVNLSVNEEYNRGLSVINSTENINSSMTHRISLTIDNRKKDKWDVETGTALTITDSRYSVQNSLNNVYSDIAWFAEARYTPNNRINFMTSADITSYSARTFSESQLVPLIGAEVNYYFMKNQRGVLSLAGIDLLNRNKGIDRLSELTYLVERKSSIIGRYVMLSFKYRLNKVGDNNGGINIQVKRR